ncbi:MAG: STAS domain-containing protein [Clostridia bacterium]|nr:STAS domain-containing protein [Clostridia bacterium]
MQEVTIKGMENGALHISLSGEIEMGKAEEFYRVVAEAYNAAPANICFDCEQLNFIDSTTLGTFVKILKAVKSDGHTMKLRGLQSKIKKLFLICSLDSIMEIA